MTTTERTFDWTPKFDVRSRQFPIRTLLSDLKPRSYTWSCEPKLNQGNEGACVGFGMAHELAARPAPVTGITNKSALNIYGKAKEIDEWEGEDYEGTSVHAGAKVVKNLGLITEYRWAFNVQDVLLTLGYRGPVVVGINWYEGMEEPNANGLILAKGELLGGHCVCLRGINVKTGLVRVRNSWGEEWGDKGDAFLPFGDLERLLKEDGEACVPIGRRL